MPPSAPKSSSASPPVAVRSTTTTSGGGGGGLGESDHDSNEHTTGRWSPPSVAIQNATELAAKEVQLLTKEIARLNQQLDQVTERCNQTTLQYRELVDAVGQSVEMLARTFDTGPISRIQPDARSPSILSTLVAVAVQKHNELERSKSTFKETLREAQREQDEYKRIATEKITRLETQLSWAKNEIAMLRSSKEEIQADEAVMMGPRRVQTAGGNSDNDESTTAALLKILVKEQSKTLRSLQEHVLLQQRPPTCTRHDHTEMTHQPMTTTTTSRSSKEQLRLLDTLERAEKAFDEWRSRHPSVKV